MPNSIIEFLEPNLKDCATFDTSKKGEFNIFTKAGINDDNLFTTIYYWLI